MLKKILGLLTLMSVTSFAFADTVTPVMFSPYVDLTIDTTWNNQTNSTEPMDLTQVSAQTGIKNYHLAFINDSGNCTPVWSGMNKATVKSAWGKTLFEKMQAQGIGYTISFGGSNGTDMSSACGQDQLTAVYEQVIDTYNPEGLDFDIENGTANVAKLLASVKQIQTTHPNLKISFTLEVMPQGFLSPEKSILKQAKAAGINFSVNIMVMDYGSNYQGDMGQYAVQALSNSFTFLKFLYPQNSDAQIWQMLQATAEIGVNDEATEHFTLSDADTLKNFANHNQIGAVSMWSVARDQPCSDNTALPTCSGANLQTVPYEFTQHFLAN